METMTVIANGHGPVATEENSHRFIEDKPITVNCTAYYLRRLADGELKTVKSVEPTAPAKADEPSALQWASPGAPDKEGA